MSPAPDISDENVLLRAKSGADICVSSRRYKYLMRGGTPRYALRDRDADGSAAETSEGINVARVARKRGSRDDRRLI